MANIGDTIPYISSTSPTIIVGDVTYAWSISPSGGGIITPNSSAQNINIEWIAAGTYTVNLDVTNNCSTAHYDQQVIVT